MASPPLPAALVDKLLKAFGQSVNRVEFTSDMLGAFKHLAENAAETVYKRFKYTQTPLQTARLSKGAALGCLLLWEATLWRSGTSSRVIRADELAHWVSVQMLHRQAFKHLFVSTAAPHNVWAISGPAVPTSLQLQDGRVVVPKTRIAPESHCSSVSLRAADVLRGSVDEMHVVIKTSTHTTEEISHHINLAGDGPVLASLRSPAAIVDATLQAAHAIKALTMNRHLHGDVFPRNIAYQDGKGVLLDLATLKPLHQGHLQASSITGTPAFMSLAVLKGSIKGIQIGSTMYCSAQSVNDMMRGN
ncbi:hypothetical protein WJX82_011162 [Trebouxia sp. C0006]